MPKSDRAPSRSWRQNATSCCSASSNCAPKELRAKGTDPATPREAAKAVGVSALWRLRTGEDQDIEVDVRKALRRFSGFFDLKWETINGRPPVLEVDPNLFRETRDGRRVIRLNIYPKLAVRELSLLRCDPARNPCATPFCSGASTTW
ncbi:hypothetical protein [Paraburkholderia sp. RL18-085-BIA-A]|jgi:hypothetical protein|uniref:hypothetical protein n=1 Tax=Paraburkholderia sp. RL18-085-BIA-A TaxID=3031633 RepID=UPI0038B977F0